MKEYVERESLLIGVDGCISALHAQAKGDPVQEGAIKLVEATRDYIASLSAADVAPVVRCRECEFYREFRTKRYNQLMRLCYRMGKHDMEFTVKPDDFCSYGQRKEDEQ